MRVKEPISGFYTINFDGLVRTCFFNKYFIKNSQNINIAIVAQTIDLTRTHSAENIAQLTDYTAKILGQ